MLQSLSCPSAAHLLQSSSGRARQQRRQGWRQQRQMMTVCAPQTRGCQPPLPRLQRGRRWLLEVAASAASSGARPPQRLELLVGWVFPARPRKKVPWWQSGPLAQRSLQPARCCCAYYCLHVSSASGATPLAAAAEAHAEGLPLRRPIDVVQLSHLSPGRSPCHRCPSPKNPAPGLRALRPSPETAAVAAAGAADAGPAVVAEFRVRLLCRRAATTAAHAWQRAQLAAAC